jgi:hypothetical protein
MNFDGENRRGKGLGIAASTPDFGIFVGHRLPSQESSPLGNVEVQETHAGIGFAVGPNLSFGIAAITARADWEGFGTHGTHASAWSLSFGARARLSKRWVLGVSARPSMPIQSPGGTNYWSLVEIPSRLSASATWLTNTPFKIHFGFSGFGAQDETVALAEPTRPTARVFSIQPRLGIEYTAYKDDLTQFDLYAGSYWEPARIEGLSTRTHFTGGAGLKVWAGRASIAFDRAEGYSNFIAGIGVDVLDLAVKIKLIPIPDSIRESKTNPKPKPFEAPPVEE